MTSASRPSIAAVRPLWAVEGGRVVIEGSGFRVDPPPQVLIGGVPARLASASSRMLNAVVPAGLEGGRMPVRVDGAPGETAFVDVGAPLATGLHQVDNPAFDREGNLYVTFSGSRGQQAPVSIYVVRPDGSREPFVADVPNPTSLAFDHAGRLHVSSRFDGSVHRIDADGHLVTVATDLGVACGIAFGPDGDLFVGDRSGSILRVGASGRAALFATLPPSVAAFHLAFGPDGWLYVTAPTLGTRDCVYRISADGQVDVFRDGFGRPQGLAFDPLGQLYVVDAIAGGGGLYRMRVDDRGSMEQMVSGGALVGLAFDPRGGLVLAAADTVYRVGVPTGSSPSSISAGVSR